MPNDAAMFWWDPERDLQDLLNNVVPEDVVWHEPGDCVGPFSGFPHVHYQSNPSQQFGLLVNKNRAGATGYGRMPMIRLVNLINEYAQQAQQAASKLSYDEMRLCHGLIDEILDEMLNRGYGRK